MSEQEPDPNAELVTAVEQYMGRIGWNHPDLMLTDVMMVAVSRGFDQSGSKSRTTTIVPTDSSVPMLLGMTRYAQMRFEKIVVESFVDEERE